MSLKPVKSGSCFGRNPYFTGKRYRKGETCLTLLMIDIDAHKVGDLKNAMRFAEHLRDNFLPNCYIEVSTNGNGAHIFVIVDKTDWEDGQYNAVLKEFDHWLKGVFAETGIELDGVEIKGSCALVSWKDGMPTHTTGTLAKLPREWERFDELRASPKYTAHQLLAMPKQHPVELTKKTVARVQKMRREGSVLFQGWSRKGSNDGWRSGSDSFLRQSMSARARTTAWW